MIPSAPRLLLLGWVNGPHLALWANAMAARGWEVHMAGEVDETLPRSFPAAAASVRVMPRRGVPGLRAAALVPWLRALSSALSPSIVHAHWLPSFGWMAARARLRPLVVSAWGSDVLRAAGAVRRRSRVAVEFADLVFADSEDLLHATRALSRRAVRGSVVRWGVDTTAFAPAGEAERAAIRSRLGLRDGPVVMGIRSLEPLEIYNTMTLAEAFAVVRARHPGATLVLKHPRSAVPAELAATLKRAGGEAPRIVGAVSTDELAHWYRAADVCVSIPATDSSPVSVWEAMACARPCVLSDLPWARAELVDGREALLAPVDRDAVAAAIASVLDVAALARRIGAGARRAASARMDQAAHMDTVDRLYRELAR